MVLGTGAAALTAAIRAADEGATVGLFEKADTVGGTSAWSGGMVWIPMNPHMAELGIEDSREEVHDLPRRRCPTVSIDLQLAGAMIDAGPEVVSWLEANTPVRFQIIKDFPDYHPEHPGAKPGGGRSLECPLFPFDELGEWQHRVTVGPQLSGNITMGETSLGRGAPAGVAPAELERRKIRDERGAGQGLVGPLLKACLDRGIEPQTGMRAVELVRSGGRIAGVRFETADGDVEVGATRGVVMATGGFEWDRELVLAFIRGPLVRSASVPTNTGDGLKMAMRVGAGARQHARGLVGADDRRARSAAGWPRGRSTASAPGRTASWSTSQAGGSPTRPRTTTRSAPRSTSSTSRTFEYVNHPAWLVFDRHYLTKYGLAGFKGADATTPTG